MNANPNIAGDPAPTKPSARDRLIAKVAFHSDRYEADFLAELDAYRAEVLAEAADAVAVYTGTHLDANAKMLRRMAAEAGESRG